MTTASEYRDLISELSDARAILLSAATGDEQRKEAMRLRQLLDAFRGVACPRASERDLDRADRVVRVCELLLEEKAAQFKAADAMLCRLAYGKTYEL